MNNCYIKNNFLKIDVNPACHFPKGYGLAYYDMLRNMNVCYPLGINWIVWICREVYFKISLTPKGREHRLYQFGWDEGFRVANSYTSENKCPCKECNGRRWHYEFCSFYKEHHNETIQH